MFTVLLNRTLRYVYIYKYHLCYVYIYKYHICYVYYFLMRYMLYLLFFEYNRIM
mgnify:CR=1 FL=1